MQPHYIVSSRGVARLEQVNIENQQREADVMSLIHEGIRRVNHNRRPNFSHNLSVVDLNAGKPTPVFAVPTIVGRVFNGVNFAPMMGIKVELLQGSNLVTMRDGNWQNPCRLVANNQGTFSFYPTPMPAKVSGERKEMDFSIRVDAPEFAPLLHFFTVPVISEIQSAGGFNMNRTFKLPDLFMFPPEAEAEENLQKNPTELPV
jgi:competence protein ComFB